MQLRRMFTVFALVFGLTLLFLGHWMGPEDEPRAYDGQMRIVTKPDASLPSTVTVPTPKGGRSVQPVELGHYDIPLTALLAYQRAADILASVKPSCGLPWTLLAAIGRVESDHGRYAASTLGADGVSSPQVVGVALDGEGPVAKIHDTDDGLWDQDRTWDRAVGPMQFLPQTWQMVGVDGDGDGTRSVDDIDDAALAAGVYLCAGPEVATQGGLTAPEAMAAALHRYNDSAVYVALVMAYEEKYRGGEFKVATEGGQIAEASAALSGHPLTGTPVKAGTSDEVRAQARINAGTRQAVAEAKKTGGRTPGISGRLLSPAGARTTAATPFGPDTPAAAAGRSPQASAGTGTAVPGPTTQPGGVTSAPSDDATSGGSTSPVPGQTPAGSDTATPGSTAPDSPASGSSGPDSGAPGSHDPTEEACTADPASAEPTATPTPNPRPRPLRKSRRTRSSATPRPPTRTQTTPSARPPATRRRARSTEDPVLHSQEQGPDQHHDGGQSAHQEYAEADVVTRDAADQEPRQRDAGHEGGHERQRQEERRRLQSPGQAQARETERGSRDEVQRQCGADLRGRAVLVQQRDGWSTDRRRRSGDAGDEAGCGQRPAVEGDDDCPHRQHYAQQHHRADQEPQRLGGEHRHQRHADRGARDPQRQRPGQSAPVDLVMLANQRDQGHPHGQPEQQVGHQLRRDERDDRGRDEPQAQADEPLDTRGNDKGGDQDGRHPCAHSENAQPFRRLRRTYCMMPPLR